MKWKEIFDTGIEMGHIYDIRNIDKPGSYNSGYADSRIIYGEEDREVNTVYAAIDAGAAELLVVRELNKKGTNIDAVIMHHPTGSGSYNLIKVVELQKYNWVRHGVDPVSADRIYKNMIEDEAISINAGNHFAVENTAALLDVPVICMHTAVDNIVQAFFEGLMAGKDHKTLNDILNEINVLDECRIASDYGDAPFIIGRPEARAGNIMVDMTGGVDPDQAIFPLLKKSGVDTLVAMHYGIDNIKAIRKNKINAVISGHMASDSIGLNKYCNRLEEKGLKILQGPGFHRA